MTLNKAHRKEDIYRENSKLSVEVLGEGLINSAPLPCPRVELTQGSGRW